MGRKPPSDGRVQIAAIDRQPNRGSVDRLRHALRTVNSLLAERCAGLFGTPQSTIIDQQLCRPMIEQSQTQVR